VSASPRNKEVDVLVYDSTPAGILAAVAAAQSGLQVLIVTEDRHVGGMQTSGLGNTNAGQRTTLGGLARVFYQRIHRFYIDRYGETSPQARDSQEGFRFEPHVARRVYLDWLREAGVECWTEDWIKSVEKDGPRLLSVRLASGRKVGARVFVDASYEGDLFHLAGCGYHVGRESSRTYGESLAGARFPPRRVGEGDKKIQGFDYRLCLTDQPENRVPFRRPPNYDPARYAFESLAIRVAPPGRLHDLIPLNRMPNEKTDSRTGRWVGGSWDYPEASLEERRRIEAAHKEYSAGYVWFLLTHPSVPAFIREELSRWGHARDEFTDNDHWPYHIYVREARRLVGDSVMIQRDVTEDRYKPDAVALGSFYLDVHPVQILTGLASDLWSGEVEIPEQPRIYGMVAEGGLDRTRVRPYEIPYRVLLPREREATNLLVPVCVSASHVAFSTLRMEPVYQMLGHAAGLAAALCLEHGTSVQRVLVQTLRERLRADGQILDAAGFHEFWG
jgi:hypothetical protein